MIFLNILATQVDSTSWECVHQHLTHDKIVHYYKLQDHIPELQFYQSVKLLKDSYTIFP